MMEEAIVMIVATVVEVLPAKIPNWEERRGSTRTIMSCILFYIFDLMAPNTAKKQQRNDGKILNLLFLPTVSLSFI